MAQTKKANHPGSNGKQVTSETAAMLAGVIYQSRLLNRQAKLNIPEEEIVSDVVNLWHKVMDRLNESEV